MPEIVACPNCRKRLHLPEEYFGREVRCPSCDRKFVPLVQDDAPPSEGREAALTADAPLPERSAPAVPPSEPPEPWTRPSAVQRFRPPKQPTSQGKWIGVLAVLGGIGIIVAIAANLPGKKRDEDALREKQEQANRNAVAHRQAEMNNFRAQRPLTVDEIKKQVTPLFETLGKALRERDVGQVTLSFHIERMIEELEAQPEIPRALFANRANTIMQFRRGFSQAIIKQAPLLEWESFQIKDVLKLEGNEAVALVRHTAKNGIVVRMRWWVTKRSGNWQVFDFEDLSVGQQMSIAMAMAASSNLIELQSLSRAASELNEAVHAVVRGDVDGADKHLQRIVDQRFPPKLDAMRWYFTGIVRLSQEKHQEALTAFDKAAELYPDMPILDFGYALAYDKLSDWRKSLSHIEKFRKRLDDDAVVCHVLGNALRGLGRSAEACKAYRSSLDYNPKDAEIFFTLVVTLSKSDRRDDLAARYAKLEEPREVFESWAEQYRQSRDADSLGKMAEAMQELDPQYTSAPYYLCLARAWEGKAEPAIAAFRAAIIKQPDHGRHREYAHGFLQAAVDGSLGLEAYRAMGDAREAFQVVAAQVKQRYLTDDLPELIAAHAKRDPDDPLLPFYRGEMLVRQGRYALADKEFTAAMARKPDEFTAGQFRDSRVLARYHTGQALAALKEIGPRDATFKQLAQLCLTAENTGKENLALLETLLEAQAKDLPKNTDATWYHARLKVRQKKAADAVALFREALANQPDEEQKESRLYEFLHEMQTAGFVIEGYQAAPDGRKAFQILTETLQEAGEWKDLRKLLEAHQKRHPDDPSVHFWTGELAMHDKQWERAIAAFKEWLAKRPETELASPCWSYVVAMYRTGQGIKAYTELDPGGAPMPGAAPAPLPDIHPQRQVFTQLADLMVADRKWDELQRLIVAHRERVPDDPELFWFEARGKLAMKKFAEAAPLVQKAYEKQKQDYRRQAYVREFVHDMDDGGQGIQAYRLAPDKPIAFTALAPLFVMKKRDRDLELLLAEHGKKHAEDPWQLHYSAELHLLRGDLKRAEEYLTVALAKATATEIATIRSSLQRVRIKRGKVVTAYEELGKSRRNFEMLADLCVTENNAAQLEALLGLHRQACPEYPLFAEWEVHLRWLKQDYEGTLKLLGDVAQAEDNRHWRFRWRFGDYRVRCLIKSKRIPEAIREAEALIKKGQDHLPLILAHAANSDVKQAMAAVEQAGENSYLLTTCYADADLGPILKSEAFRAFRDKFPEPKMGKVFVD